MSAERLVAAVQPLGWTVLLTLCQTTLLALLVWTVARCRPLGAAGRHALAYAGLLASVAAAAVTYGVLHSPSAARVAPLRASSAAAVSQAQVSAASAGSSAAPAAGPRGTGRGTVATGRPIAVVATAVEGAWARVPRGTERLVALVLASGWTIAVLALLLRLGGGLLLLAGLRRGARPLASAETLERARAVSRRFGFSNLEWLQSSEIDSPAAIGWRHPAVLLPVGLDDRLPGDLLEPLIAHELEHLRQRDPVKAAVQAACDALLFHCPGARWLSTQARTAREERCDDAALAACGSSIRCAEALGALVGARPARTPEAFGLGALGIGAPSLARRIERLVRGETMPRTRSRQWAVVIGGLFLSLALGGTLGSRALAVASEEPITAAPEGRVPTGARTAADDAVDSPGGFFPHQPAAPVSLSLPEAGGGFRYQSVRVRNVGETTVRAVRFAAVLERFPVRGSTEPWTPGPVRVVRSGRVPVQLQPGEAARVRLDLLPVGELRTHGQTREQPMLAVVEVEFEGDPAWSVRVDEAATTPEAAVYMSGSLLSRATLAAGANGRSWTCIDDKGLEYSPGAIVRVHDGPPDWARCEKGAWAPYMKMPAGAKPPA